MRKGEAECGCDGAGEGANKRKSGCRRAKCHLLNNAGSEREKQEG